MSSNEENPKSPTQCRNCQRLYIRNPEMDSPRCQKCSSEVAKRLLNIASFKNPIAFFMTVCVLSEIVSIYFELAYGFTFYFFSYFPILGLLAYVLLLMQVYEAINRKSK